MSKHHDLAAAAASLHAAFVAFEAAHAAACDEGRDLDNPEDAEVAMGDFSPFKSDDLEEVEQGLFDYMRDFERWAAGIDAREAAFHQLQEAKAMEVGLDEYDPELGPVVQCDECGKWTQSDLIGDSEHRRGHVCYYIRCESAAAEAYEDAAYGNDQGEW